MRPQPSLPYDRIELQKRLADAGLIDAQATIELTEYPPKYIRQDKSRRWHYKVADGKGAFVHLIAGLGLSSVHEKAAAFFEACPDLGCRPLLFWRNVYGIDQVVLEHFEGIDLDSLVKTGRCDGTRWSKLTRQTQEILEKTRSVSDKSKLLGEIASLLEKIAQLPEASTLDMTILRNLAVPALLQVGTAPPLYVRWSNGDFSGRNLLIDNEDRIRLIDYEFASQTHFGGADWLRLKYFSVLPKDLNQETIACVTSAAKPQDEVWFWLHQLSLLTDAEPSQSLTLHRNEITSEAFAAIAKIGQIQGNNAPASLIIGGLTAHLSAKCALLNERTTWAKSLENDLRAALDALSQQSALAKERLAWARSLEAELDKSRLDFAHVVEERKEIAAWAKSLEHDLQASKTHFDQLSKEYNERLLWAQTLNSELTAARAAHAELAKLVDDRTVWAKSLEGDLEASKTHFDQLSKEHNERLLWAQTLNAELTAARVTHAELIKLVDDRTVWAKSLEQDLERIRLNFNQLTKEHTERTLWAQKLNAELAAARVAHISQTDTLKLEIERLTQANNSLLAYVQKIRETCASLAGAALLNSDKGEIALLEQCSIELTGLRRDVAAKQAEVNAAVGAGLDATMRLAAADSENRNMRNSLSDAQVHLDNLLLEANRLQEEVHTLGELQAKTQALLQQREKELHETINKLDASRRTLDRYEASGLCRLAARLSPVLQKGHNHP